MKNINISKNLTTENKKNSFLENIKKTGGKIMTVLSLAGALTFTSCNTEDPTPIDPTPTDPKTEQPKPFSKTQTTTKTITLDEALREAKLPNCEAGTAQVTTTEEVKGTILKGDTTITERKEISKDTSNYVCDKEALKPLQITGLENLPAENSTLTIEFGDEGLDAALNKKIEELKATLTPQPDEVKIENGTVKLTWYEKNGVEGKTYVFSFEGKELSKQDPEITFSAPFPQSVSVEYGSSEEAIKTAVQTAVENWLKQNKIEATSGATVEITYQYNAQTQKVAVVIAVKETQTHTAKQETKEISLQITPQTLSEANIQNFNLPQTITVPSGTTDIAKAVQDSLQKIISAENWQVVDKDGNKVEGSWEITSFTQNPDGTFSVKFKFTPENSNFGEIPVEKTINGKEAELTLEQKRLAEIDEALKLNPQNVFSSTAQNVMSYYFLNQNLLPDGISIVNGGSELGLYFVNSKGETIADYWTAVQILLVTEYFLDGKINPGGLESAAIFTNPGDYKDSFFNTLTSLSSRKTLREALLKNIPSKYFTSQ